MTTLNSQSNILKEVYEKGRPKKMAEIPPKKLPPWIAKAQAGKSKNPAENRQIKSEAAKRRLEEIAGKKKPGK